MPQFPREAVEHAQLIAVQIGDPELSQVPRFILRLGKDLGPSLPPTILQFVDFVFAIQIEPDHDGPAATVVLAERRIRQEHTALALRNAPDPALVVTPVAMEPERIHVISAAFSTLLTGISGTALGKCVSMF